MAAAFGPKGMRFAMAATAIYAAVALFGAATPPPLLLTSVLDARWLALYAVAFFYGAALNEVSDGGLAKLVLVLALGVLLAKQDPQFVTPMVALLFGGAAIWVGRNLNLDRVVTRGWDLSYGVYIYAFPCEQLAVRALPPHDRTSFALYYATALAATLAFAFASWIIVEKPALAAKARIAGLIERGVDRLRPSHMQVLREPKY
jgi:peptidoglycan/LPS O-acetylase OafA/YrhL